MFEVLFLCDACGVGLPSLMLLPCNQEGERFDKVAQEYSEGKAKGIWIHCALVIFDHLRILAGGSLGWMNRGSMVVRLGFRNMSSLSTLTLI